jgi:hypothetical protein
MSRTHVFTVAALIAVAAVAGFSAVGRTVQLGASSRHANDALIAAKTKQLSAFERSLHKQLAAAPKVPTAAPAPAAAAPRAERVAYVRPAPIIVHTHRAGGEPGEAGEHESQGESEGGDD